MKPLEQPIERVPPELVRNVGFETALQRMWLEEASVQEGNGTKRDGSSTSSG
jgi:hypothetical protein